MNKVICPHCRKEIEYTLDTRKDCSVIHSIQVWYDCIEAHCIECGQEVWVGDLDDHNVEEFWKAYDKL